jgi:hypothetical protein
VCAFDEYWTVGDLRRLFDSSGSATVLSQLNS